MISKQKYGPWALVIGGSEGLGIAFARQIAESGINVVLVARKKGPLAEAAALVRAEYPVEVRTLSLDMTADDMVDRIRSVTDDIEIGLLVYNAGAAHVMGRFLDLSIDDAMRIINLNVVGQTKLSHHFGRKMVARRHGGIILFGSMAQIAGSFGVIAYSGAKAFSQMFAEGLWAEVKDLGVDVVHIPLGSFKTPSMERIRLVHGSTDFDSQVRDLLDNIANGPVYVDPPNRKMFKEFGSMPRDEAALLKRSQMVTLPGLEGPWEF
jgi:short-subunit dehydrogenase